MPKNSKTTVTIKGVDRVKIRSAKSKFFRGEVLKAPDIDAEHYKRFGVTYSRVGHCAAWYVLDRAVLFRVGSKFKFGNLQKGK